MTTSILLVDNTPATVVQVTTLLTAEGYLVVHAANGADALTQLAIVKPWLILVAERLPDMPGSKFLEAMDASLNGAPRPAVIFLLMPGAPGGGRQLDFGESRPDLYISDPFNSKGLSEYVHRIRKHFALPVG